MENMSDTFVAYWKQQQALRRRQNQQSTKLARRDLNLIVQALRENYGVQRIILFGSLAKGQFTAESDIDLAVAGLAPADFFTAYAEVNRLSRFPVDLKPLESLYPHFYQRVLSQGEIIYEAPDPG
jgi:predicted nucleotidyltransferase